MSQNLSSAAVMIGALRVNNYDKYGMLNYFSDEYTCSPTVGRLPEQIMSGGNNWANLMVSNAFPCSGYVVAWRFNRAVSYGSVYVGVFRQTSDTEFKLIAKTLLPEGISGVQFYEPDPPILVQRGDFIGLFHSRNTRGEVIARDGDSAGESQQQNIYASFFDEDIQQGLTFSITDFVNQENQASYAIQADMSYDNVPGKFSNSLHSGYFFVVC